MLLITPRDGHVQLRAQDGPALIVEVVVRLSELTHAVDYVRDVIMREAARWKVGP